MPLPGYKRTGALGKLLKSHTAFLHNTVVKIDLCQIQIQILDQLYSWLSVVLSLSDSYRSPGVTWAIVFIADLSAPFVSVHVNEYFLAVLFKVFSEIMFIRWIISSYGFEIMHI